MACCAALAQDAAALGGIALERAESIETGIVEMPAADAAWQPVNLPDPWAGRKPPLGVTVWYRVRFDLGDRTRPGNFLYAPRLTAPSIELYLNGQLLARHTDLAARGAPIVPLYLRLPPELLRHGENEIHARVHGSPAWLHGMPRLHVGKGYELWPTVRYWRLLQVEIIMVFAFAFALVGVLAIAIWAVDRTDALLWYGGTGVAYGVLTWVWYVSMGGTQFTHWHLTLIFLRYSGLITPLAVLHLRLAGWRMPWLEWLLWALLACAALAIPLVGPDLRYRIWIGFGLFYGVLPLLFLIPIARSRVVMPRISRSALSLASVIAASFTLHDWAARAGLVDFDAPQLVHYVVPFIMIACGMVIFERFVAATRRQRELTVELEARVAEKTREIEAAHAQMRAADEERALVRERRRIMADMHDGLGSRLVGLLSQVQSGKADARQLEEGLTAALEELRTTIDSLQPVEGDLGVVLGNVRHRMRSVFDIAGVELGWRVGELPRLDDLTPARNLAIQRILLELFTNVLKHSGARKVEVSTRAGAGRASIVIEDDGRGFVVGSPVNGHGLRNLQERARDAGGTLVIESAPGRGTRATLALPAAA